MKHEDAEEYTQSLGQIGGGFWRQIALAQRLGVPKALGLTTEQWVNDRLGGYVKMNVADRREAVKELTEQGHTTREIGAVVGVDHSTASRDVVANATPEEPEAEETDAPPVANATPIGTLAGVVAIQKAARVAENEETAAQRTEKVAFDARKIGKFSLILADPPWDDEFGRSDRSIENHYPTMSIDEICALPVRDISYADSMLYLWATSSMLENALAAVEAWGFEYRTQLVWRKPSIGLGKYVRQQHELLLICRRGKHPAPDPKTLPASVIDAKRGKHSEKPVIFHKIIERCYPAAEKIELFRRGAARPGWSAWGNQSQQAAE